MSLFGVDEIVEYRSSCCRFDGWREGQIVEIFHSYEAWLAGNPGGYGYLGTFKRGVGRLPIYVYANQLSSTEPYMRKKNPPSEDAAFTRFKKTLKQLETVS